MVTAEVAREQVGRTWVYGAWRACASRWRRCRVRRRHEQRGVRPHPALVRRAQGGAAPQRRVHREPGPSPRRVRRRPRRRARRVCEGASGAARGWRNPLPPGPVGGGGRRMHAPYTRVFFAPSHRGKRRVRTRRFLNCQRDLSIAVEIAFALVSRSRLGRALERAPRRRTRAVSTPPATDSNRRTSRGIEPKSLARVPGDSAPARGR